MINPTQEKEMNDMAGEPEGKAMTFKEDVKAFGDGIKAKAGEALKSDTSQYAVLGAVLGLTLGLFLGFPQLAVVGLVVGIWKGLTK